ncbi:MAG: hypothetical protein MJ195_00340 [Mycoplasmoidaceae bacterium]|nr:hypothetical protein [Mycoplasmoidaceae bacterium]
MVANLSNELNKFDRLSDSNLTSFIDGMQVLPLGNLYEYMLSIIPF